MRITPITIESILILIHSIVGTLLCAILFIDQGRYGAFIVVGPFLVNVLVAIFALIKRNHKLLYLHLFLCLCILAFGFYHLSMVLHLSSPPDVSLRSQLIGNSLDTFYNQRTKKGKILEVPFFGKLIAVAYGAYLCTTSILFLSACFLPITEGKKDAFDLETGNHSKSTVVLRKNTCKNAPRVSIFERINPNASTTTMTNNNIKKNNNRTQSMIVQDKRKSRKSIPKMINSPPPSKTASPQKTSPTWTKNNNNNSFSTSTVKSTSLKPSSAYHSTSSNSSYDISWSSSVSPQPVRSSTHSSILSIRKMKAIKKYKPVLDDELILYVGDIICVEEVYEDGWGCGTKDSSGEFGAFPMNCLRNC